MDSVGAVLPKRNEFEFSRKVLEYRQPPKMMRRTAVNAVPGRSHGHGTCSPLTTAHSAGRRCRERRRSTVNHVRLDRAASLRLPVVLTIAAPNRSVDRGWRSDSFEGEGSV